MVRFLKLSGRFAGWCCLALVLLLGGCSFDSRSTTELLNDSVAAAQKGEWEDCGKIAWKVLNNEPENVSALVLLALSQEKQGKDLLALETARKAGELYPDHFPAQYTLGRMLSRMENREKDAMAVLRRALAIHPGDRGTLLLLAQCAVKMNDPGALEYFMALPESLRKRSEVQNQMAVFYALRRHENPQYLNLAAQAMLQAYKSAPENPRIVLNTAYFIDYYAQSSSKAAGYYKAYLALTAHNPELSGRRAQVEARLKEISRR